ncbi:MAG: DUF3081 family protein [Oleiphilaceae bacterium]|nr:DUF3081 family protein [Oleiphilaceae bacterium]
MQEHFDSHLVLQAAEIVREKGEGNNGALRWRGVDLELAPDGYSFALQWRSCRLYVYFHNRFKFEGGGRDDFVALMDTLRALVAEQERSRA